MKIPANVPTVEEAEAALLRKAHECFCPLP
jgi:hypothetical protein